MATWRLCSISVGNIRGSADAVWNPAENLRYSEVQEGDQNQNRSGSPPQRLDSLGGGSRLVTMVTAALASEVGAAVAAAWRRIWEILSSTQPADRRASASWSQHSSTVSQI